MYIYCSECAEKLKVFDEWHDKDGFECVSISPCKTCQDKKFEEGKDAEYIGGFPPAPPEEKTDYFQIATTITKNYKEALCHF